MPQTATAAARPGKTANIAKKATPAAIRPKWPSPTRNQTHTRKFQTCRTCLIRLASPGFPASAT